MKHLHTYLLFIISVLFFCHSATAQEQDQLEEIIVTAHPLAKNGLAQAATVLGGAELEEKLQGSIGEAISREPGINSASFGTAVGRPVIHGLGATRVKTTQDRIDTLDVSVTSGDHAVTVEPFIANQISILKGASTLLYGSGAIGGVVDVETGRIPQNIDQEPLTGRVEVRTADNGGATNAAARLDGKISDSVLWHFDAFLRDADDYDIPGFVEAPALLAAEAAEEPDFNLADEDQGVLEGSRSESQGGAVGLSFVDDAGFIGFSLSTIDSQYGLVGGHHEEGEEEEEHEEGEEEEEEGVGIIDLEQTRFDIEAQLNNPFNYIDSVNFRLGINDYQHAEIEGNGEIGTLFENDGYEGRLTFNFSDIFGFNGSFGAQINDRDFSAIGEEAFVTPTESDSIGLFYVSERSFNGFDLELGSRIEQIDHAPKNQVLPARDFNILSSSLGLIFPASDAWTISGLLDYSTRAPSIEELYSNGPHLATTTFEIGDPNLEEETALGLSITANYQSESFDLTATLYHNQFDDFIYEVANGEIEDDLPVFLFLQNDAQFTGIDAEANFKLSNNLGLSLLYDFVDAELDQTRLGNLNLPRIPASRFGVGLEWQNDLWTAKINYLNVDDQNDTTQFELPTEGYDDISIFVNRTIELQDNELQLFLYGRNLGDDEQRNHTSIVKDFAPAPGRTIEVGVRLKF